MLFLYRPFHLSSKKKYLRAFVQADTIQIGGDEIITAISAYIPDHGHNAITAYIQPMQHQESQFRFVSDYSGPFFAFWFFAKKNGFFCKQKKANKKFQHLYSYYIITTNFERITKTSAKNWKIFKKFQILANCLAISQNRPPKK